MGFGAGVTEDGSLPGLVIFVERESAMADALFATLQSEGVPTTLRTGVSFLAAGARPAKGGQSIGHGTANGASGTIGCVVKAPSGGTRYVLTCNHVIAELNAAHKGTTAVWAPGANRSGTVTDRLGVVHDFADIDFRSGAYNVIDAALAKPDQDSDIDVAIDQIGIVTGVNNALAFGDRVQKTGVVTGHTQGRYRFQINAQISYANGQSALFRDLLGIVGTTADADFAAQGDSGALVLDDANAAAGQVISVASGIDLTLASAIKPVLDHFQMAIA